MNHNSHKDKKLNVTDLFKALEMAIPVKVINEVLIKTLFSRTAEPFFWDKSLKNPAFSIQI